MKEIVRQYKAWKEENPDEDYQYDMIHEFIAGELSRGDLQSIFEYLEKTV